MLDCYTSPLWPSKRCSYLGIGVSSTQPSCAGFSLMLLCKTSLQSMIQWFAQVSLWVTTKWSSKTRLQYASYTATESCHSTTDHRSHQTQTDRSSSLASTGVGSSLSNGSYADRKDHPALVAESLGLCTLMQASMSYQRWLGMCFKRRYCVQLDQH